MLRASVQLNARVAHYGYGVLDVCASACEHRVRVWILSESPTYTHAYKSDGRFRMSTGGVGRHPQSGQERNASNVCEALDWFRMGHQPVPV
jgi:hypothetical protein